MAAVPSTGSLVGRPRMVQVASVTRGVLRIRLTFQDFDSVMTSSRSPSAAAQIGTGLGLPSFVKGVSRMEWAWAGWARGGPTPQTLPREQTETSRLGNEQRGEHTVRPPQRSRR